MKTHDTAGHRGSNVPLYYGSLSYHRQTHWLRQVNCQLENGLFPRNKEGQWAPAECKSRSLAKDLTLELTSTFLHPTLKLDHPAEMTLCPAPTSHSVPSPGKCIDAWRCSIPGPRQAGPHAGIAGLPKGRARAWPYRSEPGKSKGG